MTIKTKFVIHLTIESDEPLPRDIYTRSVELTPRMIEYFLSSEKLKSYMYTNWINMGNAPTFPVWSVKSTVEVLTRGEEI